MRLAGADNLHKIVVINPKGGSGKTTLATNLASLFALRGPPPTLIDADPQGFCLRWLAKRSPDRPACHAIEAIAGETVEVPPDSRVAIIDLPAGIAFDELHRFTHMADSILLPIVPSVIDVFAASRFVAELMLDVQLDRHAQKLAIVANRVRARTKSYDMLGRFLASLHIPLIATLRDSQIFHRAAAQGLGIAELPAHMVRTDLDQLRNIRDWLDRPRMPAPRADRENVYAFEREPSPLGHGSTS